MKTALPLIFGALLFGSPVWAQGIPDPKVDPKAIAAFEEARRFIDAGNCDAAITKLNESLSLNPRSIGARLSLADCYSKSDFLAAWTQLKEASRLAYLAHDERLAVAQSRADALTSKLATVRIIVPPSESEQPGFELRVDGALVDRYFYQDGLFAFKPGAHRIEASAPKMKWAKAVIGELGNPAVVTVGLETELCPAPTAAAPTPPGVVHAEDPGSPRRTLGIVLGSVGLASVVTGAIFGIVTLGKKSSLDNACGGNLQACGAQPGSLDDQRDAARTTGIATSVAFVAGGALIAAGTALYVFAPQRSSTSRAVRLAPTLGRNEAGLNLGGAW